MGDQAVRRFKEVFIGGPKHGQLVPREQAVNQWPMLECLFKCDNPDHLVDLITTSSSSPVYYRLRYERQIWYFMGHKIPFWFYSKLSEAARESAIADYLLAPLEY